MDFRVGSYRISALHACALRLEYPNQALEPIAQPVLGVKISNKLTNRERTEQHLSRVREYLKKKGRDGMGWDGKSKALRCGFRRLRQVPSLGDQRGSTGQ